MKQSAPAISSPVEGLRHYVRNWRKAVQEHQLAARQEHQSCFRALTLCLHPEMKDETVASFFAVLDATETYIDRVLAPMYANDRNAKHQLDKYWPNRELVFCEPAEKLPVTKNGMSVARLFIDAWLEQTNIGNNTPEYAAVTQASQAFKRHIYGAESKGQWRR